MCDTCGCGPTPGHAHEHPDRHGLPAPILAANDAVAQRMRARFARAGVLALNIVGTPGSGKTALLEATLERLPARGLRAAVVVADLATENDARRLARSGAPVVALETGTTCHLTAPMLERALDRVPVEKIDVLFVENVGNLVCPALFDLGEAAKVALVSVTEGTDKPEKYPVMFQAASLAVLSKTDLLPFVEFDVLRAAALARRVHPGIEVLALSAKSGRGVEPWLDWIVQRREPARAGPSPAAALGKA